MPFGYRAAGPPLTRFVGIAVDPRHGSEQLYRPIDDQERLRTLLHDYAQSLIAEVVASSDLLEDVDGVLTDIAQDALAFTLGLPDGVVPDALPAGLRDKLALVATVTAHVEPDDLRRTFRGAFRVAGVFVTRGAFARRVDPTTMNYYVEVVQRLETLVGEVILGANELERVRVEHRDRYVRATALYELLPDQVIAAAAAADLAESREDATTAPDPATAPALVGSGPVVAVVVRPAGDGARLPSVHDLPTPSLSALATAESVLVLPLAAADELVEHFTELFGTSRAAIGLPTDLDDVASSLDWARRAQDLRDTFAVQELAEGNSGRTIVACDEMPLAMLIGADRQLLELLQQRVLKPFSGLSTFRRTILLETLQAWARHPGAGAPTIAQSLDRHPQTIRYRLKLLRDLLGDAMDDPQTMLLVRLMFVLGPRS